MTETTLELDENSLADLDELATEQGRNRSALVRDAIDAYLKERRRPAPIGVGAYRSGRGDLAERAEELLAERSRPGS